MFNFSGSFKFWNPCSVSDVLFSQMFMQKCGKINFHSVLFQAILQNYVERWDTSITDCNFASNVEQGIIQAMSDIVSFEFQKCIPHYHPYQIPTLLLNFLVVNLPCTFQPWKDVNKILLFICLQKSLKLGFRKTAVLHISEPKKNKFDQDTNTKIMIC